MDKEMHMANFEKKVLRVFVGMFEIFTDKKYDLLLKTRPDIYLLR